MKGCRYLESGRNKTFGENRIQIKEAIFGEIRKLTFISNIVVFNG